MIISVSKLERPSESAKLPKSFVLFIFNRDLTLDLFRVGERLSNANEHQVIQPTTISRIHLQSIFNILDTDIRTWQLWWIIRNSLTYCTYSYIDELLNNILYILCFTLLHYFVMLLFNNIIIFKTCCYFKTKKFNSQHILQWLFMSLLVIIIIHSIGCFNLLLSTLILNQLKIATLWVRWLVGRSVASQNDELV